MILQKWPWHAGRLFNFDAVWLEHFWIAVDFNLLQQSYNVWFSSSSIVALLHWSMHNGKGDYIFPTNERFLKSTKETGCDDTEGR